MTINAAEIKEDLLKELYDRIYYYESIDNDNLSICSVCGELYDKKANGVVCSAKCYRDKFM